MKRNQTAQTAQPEILKEKLRKREEAGLLRSLKCTAGLIDFCSNDYLGLARSVELKDKIACEWKLLENTSTGSTGSRLLTGNSAFAEWLEHDLASFHQSESALLFNSGYDANLGLFSCLGGRNDTVIYDDLIHASIRDGARLSYARHFSFRHNDLNDLRNKLRESGGNVFIAVESLYSMDGDMAPLQEIIEISEKAGAFLIVDEAHATGIFGPNGKGLVQDLGLEERIFARVHTFGKALGCHGAIVLGSNILREYLINFARPFIYTTALPLHSLLSIKCAYELMGEASSERRKLWNLIPVFREAVRTHPGIDSPENMSPIQSLIIPGNAKVKMIAHHIQSSGFDVRPILSPTVPKGSERLRICLHAFNTEEEIVELINTIADHT